jgi:formate/nitrite transporter FocA (FNT family)
VALVALAHLMDGPMGETARKIAATKASLPLDAAFFRGVLCNALVCLAVWLTIAARSVTGKIFAILWPISAFVLLGLEHSVANMYLVPAGWWAGADVTAGAFLATLAAVTVGNVVGGAGGVGLAYWLAYRPARLP